MAAGPPEPRISRRRALEVVALGALVAVAVVWAQGGDVSRDNATADPQRHDARPAAEEPTAAPVSVPSEPGAWEAMSHTELEAVGRHVAEITPGFRFDRVEVFSGGGQSNAIALLVHEKTELEFSLIPPGSSLMGSPGSETRQFADEIPRHRVTFQRAFLIARTECTQAAWDRISGDDDRARVGETLPIESVSWHAASAWCEEADLRLPSEAEWEYACRGGTTRAYWSGDDERDLRRVAIAGDGPRPAGEKPANPFGLFDVHGNVWEWCEDTWHDSYVGAPDDGSPWVEAGSEDRVCRGGSFADSAGGARSAHRARGYPGARRPFVGFRPARSVGGN